MAVCRIEKRKDYTVIANHVFRNKELSLKAKGLLTLMLSLPDNWDYTIKGLACICSDGVDSINTAVRELEKHGYITRKRIRNMKGQLKETEYTIREIPVEVSEPTLDTPKQELPIQENPIHDNPIQEKHAQLNTNKSNTKKSSTNLSNPYQSKEMNDLMGCDNILVLENIIKENIEFDDLKNHGDKQMQDCLPELVDVIIETLCSTKDTINISNKEHPIALVKSKLMTINKSHIEKFFNFLSDGKNNIKNIKKYLLASLFNMVNNNFETVNVV